MTASMSAHTLGRHREKGFLKVAEGAARFGTQYWIGDCGRCDLAQSRRRRALCGANRETLAGAGAHSDVPENRRGDGRVRRRDGL